MFQGRRAFCVSLLFISQLSFASDLHFPFVPDSSRTTGSMCDENNPDFDTHRYPEKIAYCARNVKGPRKKRIYEAYGVSVACRKNYTIDHFIPLSLGGTNSEDNLWPESKNIKALRMNLEMDLFTKLKKGRITQAEAVETIRQAKLNPPVEDPSSFEFCQ